MRITILSPHSDDAAFSVGLTIETWLDAGHHVAVVNCFTESAYGPIGDLKSVRPIDRRSYVTVLRHQEEICWTRSYIRPFSLIDLKLADAPERVGCRVDEVCDQAVNRDDAAITKIRSALEERTLDCLVLPLGIGHHVDHLTARLAAQDDWPSSFPMAFYEDLPYAARPGATADIDPVVKNIAGDLYASFARAKTDVVAAKERKRRPTLCYESQIDREVTEQIVGFCDRYGGRERFWVNRAWLAAGMGISD